MHRVDAIDPALRRYGRFDIETEVTVPNEEERLQILEVTVWNTIFRSSHLSLGLDLLEWFESWDDIKPSASKKLGAQTLRCEGFVVCVCVCK